MKSKPQMIVMDTNVIVSALRSKRGASHALVIRLGTGLYRHAVSTALVLEYEDVLLRQRRVLEMSEQEIGTVVDYLVGASERFPIHYRWRPFLKDPSDECVLELAVAAKAGAIVTYNRGHFEGVERHFGIRILNARQFLQAQGVIP